MGQPASSEHETAASDGHADANDATTVGDEVDALPGWDDPRSPEFDFKRSLASKKITRRFTRGELVAMRVGLEPSTECDVSFEFKVKHPLYYELHPEVQR